ncbi:hypothetical protein QR680_003507 [Steinernema hermaphroditum]|uniref:Major facilitator superfamily (MFS) profile domain-containing protein n=1 Tax=Steinernema hermaphroditum TaxID=289476 RepID=A0AA39HLM9_9BILA|nr:hypothetical protein QR680_003507 [Steinernema hermaphroditum]
MITPEEKKNPLQLQFSSLSDLGLRKEKSSNSSLSSKYSDCNKTPWKSIWLTYLIQFLCGIQLSVYFTSMWPYLSGLDQSATINFFGFVVAAFSVGQTISSPLLGLWSQKTFSAKDPTAFGLFLTAIGNLLYALLPNFSSNVKYIMMASRFVTGLGSGTMGVLRAYTATACEVRHRNKAISLEIASFVLGMSVGPAVQAIFAPIGKDGFMCGPLFLNMYTVPAYLMIALSILSIILLFTIFHESYAGLLSKESKSPDSLYVLPKFDKYAAGVCLFLWFLNNSLSTNMELIATPLTIALYGWNDQEAVLYNGMLQTVSCLLSVGIYFVLGCTRVGKLDRRKMIFFALTVFTIYHVVNMPWPFYDGPLNYIPKGANSTVQDTSIVGGCYDRYTWCAYTTRVPMMLYIVTATLCFGIAFPFMSSQTGTLYSEVLGPRHQGFMQGVLAFFGSVSRCVSPLISAIVFEHYGYLWPTAGQLALLITGMSLLVVFRKRLVPLQLVLRSEIATN